MRMMSQNAKDKDSTDDSEHEGENVATEIPL